jgi:hypothetical protein
MWTRLSGWLQALDASSPAIVDSGCTDAARRDGRGAVPRDILRSALLSCQERSPVCLFVRIEKALSGLESGAGPDPAPYRDRPPGLSLAADAGFV